MIKCIATQAVYVSDQRAAEDFWRNKVGFEAVSRRDIGDELYWLEVAPPGAQSRLVLYPKSLMNDWSERKPSIVFECEDVDRTYEELKDRGVDVGDPPIDMQWGRFGSFKDLDGNVFGLRPGSRRS
jgi:predicted enzyme related to lactoylglutathione lyase